MHDVEFEVNHEDCILLDKPRSLKGKQQDHCATGKCDLSHAWSDDMRGGRVCMELALQNCTSLMAHWQVLLRASVDIMVLVETKVNLVQQRALSEKARSMGLVFAWGRHLCDSEQEGRNGLLGKSGGVAILTSNGWVPKCVDLGIEMEAPCEHWQAFLVENTRDSERGSNSYCCLLWSPHPAIPDQKRCYTPK